MYPCTVISHNLESVLHDGQMLLNMKERNNQNHVDGANMENCSTEIPLFSDIKVGYVYCTNTIETVVRKKN